jgi:uncharacterized damage-inducible protein DinB
VSYSDQLLPEYDQEMASTRKVLELVPEDKFDWKAHAKLNSVGWNATHLAVIPSWVEITLTRTQFDTAPVDGPRYESPVLRTRQELLDLFDRNVAAGRRAIAATGDEDWQVMWSLLQAGQTLMTMPRATVVRTWVMNHMIHHRAHLCVYLRLNEISVPGMYGPTGD